MSLIMKEPLPGVRTLTVPDETGRFKTASLTVWLFLPLTADTAAEQAMLPFLLRRGGAAFPGFAAFKRELDRLYGAQMEAGVSRIGETQALKISITCLEDRFALNGEAVAAECADLLCRMLFEPALENGVFRAADMEEDRRCLIEDIRSLINNKRGYARAKAEELLCRGEAYALRATGTAEAVEALTADQVTAAWERVLNTARVQILYQGSGQSESVMAPFVRHFAARTRRPVTLSVTRAAHSGPLREQEEKMAVAQGKMVMGFRCRESAPDDTALRMANAVLGGTAFSLLFTNVREKLSLCYYCAASYDSHKGVGLIDSGVELAKIPAARAEILNQVARLKAGDFTDELLEDTRHFLISQYRTVGDWPGSVEDWYAGEAVRGAARTPEQFAADIAAVTKEQVVAAAATMELACEYRLLPDGTVTEGGEDNE